jgi:hypothetical protein
MAQRYLEDIAVTGTQYPERLLCGETAAGGGSAGANPQIFLQLIRRQILRPTRAPHQRFDAAAASISLLIGRRRRRRNDRLKIGAKARLAQLLCVNFEQFVVAMG